MGPPLNLAGDTTSSVCPHCSATVVAAECGHLGVLRDSAMRRIEGGGAHAPVIPQDPEGARPSLRARHRARGIDGRAGHRCH